MESSFLGTVSIIGAVAGWRNLPARPELSIARGVFPMANLVEGVLSRSNDPRRLSKNGTIATSPSARLTHDQINRFKKLDVTPEPSLQRGEAWTLLRQLEESRHTPRFPKIAAPPKATKPQNPKSCPPKESYQEYLKSDHWKETRGKALKRATWRCQVCYSDKRVDVHHRTYQRLGHEEDYDLTVLCRRCHSMFHSFAELSK